MANQSKLPAMMWYPGDWRKDVGVQSLTFHDRGVWFEILNLMHGSEQRGMLILNGAAMSEEALARLLGLDKQNLTSTLTTLLTSGVASRDDETGALMCRRMVRDENLRQIRIEAGKKGGNPVLVKQKSTTRLKQESTPSVSSSTSSSTSNPKYCAPSLEEVTAYCRERKNNINPQQWMDHYTANGWKVGRNAMKDWKAAVRTWEANGLKDNNRPRQIPSEPGTRQHEVADAGPHCFVCGDALLEQDAVKVDGFWVHGAASGKDCEAIRRARPNHDPYYEAVSQ
jgi:hypothetical protein